MLSKPLPGVFLDALHPEARELVADYPFNTGAGSQLWDYSFSQNHGDINGAAWVPEGLRFNGTSTDFVAIPDSQDWDFPGDFTMAIKFKLNSVSANTALCGQAQDGNNYWRLLYVGSVNYFQLLVRSGGVIVILFEGATFPWVADVDEHCAVLRRTGKTFEMFIDGNSIGTGNDSSPWPNYSGAFILGKAMKNSGSFDFFLDGLMIGASIWNGIGLSISDINLLALDKYGRYQRPFNSAVFGVSTFIPYPLQGGMGGGINENFHGGLSV